MFSFGHLVSLIGNYVGFIKWANVCKQNMYALYVNAIFFFFLQAELDAKGVMFTPLHNICHSFPRNFTLNQIYSRAPKQKFGVRDL